MKKEPTQTISRRSALKRMGLLVAGAAALGVPATLAALLLVAALFPRTIPAAVHIREAPYFLC